MPIKTCLKCQHENHSFYEEPNAECPKCGAIYSKVEAHHKLQQEIHLKQEAKREEEKRLAEQRDAQRKAYAATAGKQKNNTVACDKCGSIGNPKKLYKGSIFAEIFFYIASLVMIFSFVFLIFGLIGLIVSICYSIYRQFSRIPACNVCGSKEIIPINSPKGRLIAEKHGIAA